MFLYNSFPLCQKGFAKLSLMVVIVGKEKREGRERKEKKGQEEGGREGKGREEERRQSKER